jgi:hypothetical protein
MRSVTNFTSIFTRTITSATLKTSPQRQRTMWTRCSLKAPWTDELTEELHKSARCKFILSFIHVFSIRKTTSITVYNCYRSALLSLFFIVIFSKEMTSYKLLSLFLKTDSSYHIYREIAKNELIKLYTIETSTVNRLMELARKTDYLIYIPYLYKYKTKTVGTVFTGLEFVNP